MLFVPRGWSTPGTSAVRGTGLNLSCLELVFSWKCLAKDLELMMWKRHIFCGGIESRNMQTHMRKNAKKIQEDSPRPWEIHQPDWDCDNIYIIIYI